MNQWNLKPEPKWKKVLKNVLLTVFMSAVAYSIIVMMLCM